MEENRRSLSVNDACDYYGEARLTEPPSFGILDLSSTIIYAAPIFSEYATVEAMRRLSYNGEDLVIDKITDYSGDPSIRVLVSLDLERERLLKIERIINLRNKIINDDIVEEKECKGKIRVEGLRIKKRKNTKKDKDPFKHPSVRSYNVPFCPKENVTIPRKIIDSIDQNRRLKSERLQKGAQERYLRQQHTIAVMEARRRESAAQSALELKKQTEQMNKMHAKKKKQYEAEMKWRQQNIYKPLNLPKRGNSTDDDDINKMRKKLIKNRRWNSTKIVTISRPLGVSQKGNSRIPILRRLK